VRCFLFASIICPFGALLLQATGLIDKVDTDFKNLPYGIAIGINICFFYCKLHHLAKSGTNYF